MNKVLKGLMAGALALSCMCPIAKGVEKPEPPKKEETPVNDTYSVGNVLKNSKFADFTLAGSIVAIGEGVYIGLDKAGIL